MSICLSGLSTKVSASALTISVSEFHPLVRFANALPWEELGDLIMTDLKASTVKKKWWTGRPLRVRIHLGAYLLQQLFNKTDRQIEYDIKDNAAYQVFCGCGIVKKWHCPDHTKIEEFRSRLSAETQQKCANYLVIVASRLKFAQISKMDIDSTIQEANMSYPSDMNLLGKLAAKAKQVADYVVKKSDVLKHALPSAPDLKKIKSQVRNIFFKKKNTPEERRILQQTLWRTVCSEVKPIIRFCEQIPADLFASMPWNIRRLMTQIITYAKGYLIDVASFIRHGEMQKGKLLAFHVQEVSCFNKNKLDKRLQFGRNIQLGRVGGNFLIVGASDTVRQEDKQSMQPMLALHTELFGQNTLDSVTADKGYYSKKNEIALKTASVKEIGLQKPQKNKNSACANQPVIAESLINRRAGIEPLIGHAKQKGQLGKSRMKSDITTKSAAYAAILGFNARQLIRYLNGATSLYT